MVMKNVIKQIQKIPYLFLLMLFTCLSVSAQNGITVKGVVVDQSGESVIGASVVLKGNTAVGTISDIDGNFVLNVPSTKSILVVTYVGMKPKEVQASTKLMKIELEDDSQTLDEVVVVGFGQQKKESVVGAIAQTTSKVLERTGGVSSLGQALTGNLPGVVTMTTTGKPGEEDPEITIRGVTSWNGSKPLVLVDGVERDMSAVDINSVASISVLKDASATAVFGVRGANGVILIQTKRGEEGKATVNINLNTTIKTYSKLPDVMDSYDALSLRNHVIESELGYKPDQWSYYRPYEELNKYRNPANAEEAERYPNVDWVDTMLKDAAFSYNASVNVSGGTSFVKYFAAVDYAYEGDMYKDVNSNRGYNPSFGYDRINVRSNLDFNLTKTTKLRVNLSGSHAVKKATQAQYEYLVWNAFYGLGPDSYIPQYSNGVYGYYQPNPSHAATNPLEYLATQGIGYTTTDRLNTDFTLEQDLGFLLKGLSLQGRLAFDNSFQETGRGVDDTNDWEDEAHQYIDPETGNLYSDVTVDGNNKFDYKNNIAWSTGAGSVNNWSTYRRLNYSLQLNWGQTFGKHTVGAMGNFSREQYATGNMLPFYRENWVFRTTYDYAKRYMLEYNGAYNGSEKFAKENRFAFFQSGAVGWMVSEEPLVKKLNLKWLDMFKLRASYGQIGDDNINGRWLYMDTWSYGGTFGQSLTGVSSSASPYAWYTQSQVGNPDVKWEVATKFDAAVDFAIFNGLLAGSVDYFSEKRDNILLAGTSRAVPAYFGTTAPTANLGKVESHGIEAEIRWNKMINKDWRLWGNAAYTRAINKIKEADDPKLMPEYQKKADKAINQTTAYVDNGYYNNWDELYATTPHDASDDARIPGNYIIMDYDGDGVISSYDRVPYGYTGVPQNTINAQFGVDYKGWSFFVQFYGVNNVTRSVNLNTFTESRNLAFNEGTYWNKTDLTGDVPLPTWGLIPSDYATGTRYLFDGSYMRLKYAELAYTFSGQEWMKKVGLSSMRLFVNGNNLFLWTDMPDDRESNTGGGTAYPTARRFNIGLKLTL